MQTVISMTAFRRPVYLSRVLSRLQRCDGIADCELFVSIEPGCAEVLDLVRSIDFCDVTFWVNKAVLGINMNTLKVLMRAFERPFSDFVIHVEDDILLSNDAIRYFEHCRDAYREDKDILSVTAYHKNAADAPLNRVERMKWFTPWGWGTWQDRMSELQKQWSLRGWDVHVNRELREGRSQIVPSMSRAQNIGSEGGTNVPSESFHAERHRLQHWHREDHIERNWQEHDPDHHSDT